MASRVIIIYLPKETTRLLSCKNLEVLSVLRKQRQRGWRLGCCWYLMKCSAASCIKMLDITLLIFRLRSRGAQTSSVWLWTMLTTTATQRNRPIYPQVWQLLWFNSEEFQQLFFSFFLSPPLWFYCHLLSGQGSKIPNVETQPFPSRKKQSRGTNALSCLLSSWGGHEELHLGVQEDWYRLKLFQATAASH